VIEAESQEVLNTPTERKLQEAFKNWQKCRKQCMCVERDYFKGDGGQQAQN
jgi:hypothetical protein